MTAEVGAHHIRLASRTTAVTLGALNLALAVAYVPLTHLTHVRISAFGLGLLGVVAIVGLLGLGFVVALRQPGNPVGWILLGIGVSAGFYSDAGRYAVLDYRFHDGSLPLGPAAALVASELWAALFFALPPIVLLFPDGRVSRRWRWVLWAYLVVCALGVAGLFLGNGSEMTGKPFSVDLNGQLIDTNPSSVANMVLRVLPIVALGFWLSFVGRQVVSWRLQKGNPRKGPRSSRTAGGRPVSAVEAMFEACSLSTDPRFVES